MAGIHKFAIGLAARRADRAWNAMLTEADALLHDKKRREMLSRLAGPTAPKQPGRPASRPPRQIQPVALSAERLAEIRADERKRIKAILTSEAGQKSPNLARRLAFEGSLSAADAIILLETSPDGAVVASAMAESVVRAAELARAGGPEPALPPRGSLARGVIEAGKKRRGEIG